MAATIGKVEAEQRLSEISGWALEDGALVRRLTFAGFAEAVAFVVQLGFTAEAADHHPDIRISYMKVTLSYVTHSEGGLTRKDFEGAAAAEKIAAAAGAKKGET